MPFLCRSQLELEIFRQLQNSRLTTGGPHPHIGRDISMSTSDQTSSSYQQHLSTTNTGSTSSELRDFTSSSDQTTPNTSPAETTALRRRLHSRLTFPKPPSLGKAILYLICLDMMNSQFDGTKNCFLVSDIIPISGS